MELFSIKDLNFSYSGTKGREGFALKDINFNISSGEFITLCGKSGCGKTTLLKQLKSALSPSGFRSGNIKFCSTDIEKLDLRRQASEIGFVMQKAESQIVTDTVWHEMAFGLESLGYDTDEIRLRVSEMASFFGLQSLFYRNTNTLSGGQKQLLSLASVMVLEPKILILDEPTAQLDPISAGDFMQMLLKINCEFGTAILISAHNLDEVVPISDRMIVMDNGSIIADGSPDKVILNLKQSENDMFLAMPAPAQIYASTNSTGECPLTVREGREWISRYVSEKKIREVPTKKLGYNKDKTLLCAKNIWFRYEKRENDILKNISLTLHGGEWLSIVGSTGVGKSTFLSILSGNNAPYRGKVEMFNNRVCMLPQDPTVIFEKSTVIDDLMQGMRKNDNSYLQNIISLCDLCDLLYMHPYDLSGGEQQRVALAKILLKKPRVLLLDEPTKGLDANFKRKLAGILLNLKIRGISIIMVSHDIEFCASYSDNCAFLFDGEIISQDEPRAFFSGNNFYTTSANRIARHIIPNAITTDDVIYAIGGSEINTKNHNKKESGTSLKNATLSSDLKPVNMNIMSEKTSIGSSIVSLISLLLIPLVIYFGNKLFGERQYYYTSLAIILLSFVPFISMFEGRKPKAREIVTISALCSIGIIGRLAFYMVPQFKPTVAIIIISAMALGSQRGFLIGVLTMLISNLFMGMGPWSPWQMFACGVIGFIAGFMYKKESLPKTVVPICIFGFIATLLIYGGIMNPASLFMSGIEVNLPSVIAYYVSGLPYDLIHAVSTAVFLLILAKPMLTKLDRIKKKYGLILKGENSYN